MTEKAKKKRSGKEKIPCTVINLLVREDLKEKLDKELFDEGLGKIPHGAYRAWFEKKLERHFKSRHVAEGKGEETGNG